MRLIKYPATLAGALAVAAAASSAYGQYYYGSGYRIGALLPFCRLAARNSALAGKHMASIARAARCQMNRRTFPHWYESDAPRCPLSGRLKHPRIQRFYANQTQAAFLTGSACSMGWPAFTHASIPPSRGRIFLKPACLRCFAAVAADSSFGQAQYTMISVPGA